MSAAATAANMFYESSTTDDTTAPDDMGAVFKVTSGHNYLNKVGFCITDDHIERTGWKRIHPENEPNCPKPHCREVYNKYHRLIGREVYNKDGKTLNSHDICSNWMHIVGVTGNRKYDPSCNRVVGAWTDRDWSDMKNGVATCKPIRHARIIFLDPKDLKPLHEKPVTLKLNGAFASSFNKTFNDTVRTVLPKLKKFYGNKGDGFHGNESYVAHLPMMLGMQKSSNANYECGSTALKICNIHIPEPGCWTRCLAPRGSDESKQLLDHVRDMNRWKAELKAKNTDIRTKDPMCSPSKRPRKIQA